MKTFSSEKRGASSHVSYSNNVVIIVIDMAVNEIKSQTENFRWTKSRNKNHGSCICRLWITQNSLNVYRRLCTMDFYPKQKVLVFLWQVKKKHYFCSTTSNYFLIADVIVEKFGENDDLFLERLCFDFAADLSREACLSPCSLVLAMIYLDRLCKKNPNYVSSIPSSKLFLISVVSWLSVCCLDASNALICANVSKGL